MRWSARRGQRHEVPVPVIVVRDLLAVGQDLAGQAVRLIGGQ
jgi:hypothetical protein